MSVDGDVLRKAFQNLQSKLVETNQGLKMVEIEISSNEQRIKHSSLVLKELAMFPNDTKMYEDIGRMFVLEQPVVVVEHINDRVSKAATSVTSLKQKKQYLEKSYAEAEKNIRELVAEKQKGK